jgi:ribosomal protein S18 acetylase RimI-like enzyme
MSISGAYPMTPGGRHAQTKAATGGQKTLNSTTLVDSERAISVITLAFSADPICRWVWPDPHAYFRHFPRFVRAFGGEAFASETAYIAEDYAGAALWLPPGVEADGDELATVVTQTVAADLMDPLGELMEMQHECHPEGQHWYLPLIGVDPIQQGRGHGSRLLRQAFERIDREGLPAYLEATTPESRSLYARHGFEVVREIQAAGSPPMWPMVRTAQR